VKTVPTLRVVSKSETTAELDELGVTDLPPEVRLALLPVAELEDVDVIVDEDVGGRLGAHRDGVVFTVAVLGAHGDAVVRAHRSPQRSLLINEMVRRPAAARR
jgi:hypothetical protein